MVSWVVGYTAAVVVDACGAMGFDALKDDRAGPFLKYENLKVDAAAAADGDVWSGSVLYVTKQPKGTTGGGGTGGDGAPTLILRDESHPDERKRQHAVIFSGVLLDTVLDWCFWRYDVRVDLTEEERAVDYDVEFAGKKESHRFWVQKKGEPFHWGYTSCNGISGSIAEDHYSRKDPTYLWRDVLAVHGTFPLHVMVGGGDQVYSDPVWKEDVFEAWSAMPSLEEKIGAAWTEEHEGAAVKFYLENYLESYMMDDVRMAYASIPSVMMWDDHDIWDGYGSYDPELQCCEVFQGLFAVAKRFFLLFQHHTTEEFAKESAEYIDPAEGFHAVKYFGPQVAALSIDMRTKRSKARILPKTTYVLLEKALLSMPESVTHVVALSGVPVVFPSVRTYG